MPNKAFDHDQHLRRLAEAERELTILGKPELAAAVWTAYSIHIDMQGRVAHARRVGADLVRLHDTVAAIARLNADYVAQARGVSIGVDLFPEK